MIDLHPRSALGRPVDPRWPTNLAVLILIPLIGVAAAVVFGFLGSPEGFLPLLARAGTVALAGFGGWALMRELAPDDQGIAFVAMAVAAGVAGVLPETGLLALFSALLFSRVVNRSVGPELFPADYAMLAGFAGWCIWSGSPELLGAGTLAFALDARFGGRPLHYGVAVALAIPALVMAPELALVSEVGPLAILLAGSAAAFIAILRCPEPSCSNDAGSSVLERRRVRGGIAVATAAGLLASLSGANGVMETATLWAVLLVLPLANGFASSAFRTPVDAA